MYALDLFRTASGPLRILCLGAHSDDIEIGCGGFILELTRRHRAVEVDWVVFSAAGPRQNEARRGAGLFLKGARRQRVIIRQFRDGFFPYDAAIKDYFEKLKTDIEPPDLVLTHYRADRHQDHRVISNLSWNTFRDQLILEYEIPKFDGDLGSPNCFVPVDRRTCERKIKYVRDVFQSQRTKYWFEPETLRSLMRLRGVECRAPGRYAEAFYARKIVLQTP